MSKNEKLMCLIAGLWTLANSMSAVFVNVYLYAYTGSLVVMAIYTIIRIGLFPVFFYLGGKVSRKTGFEITLLAGLVFTMISLLVVLYGNNLFELDYRYVYLVAALVGTGEGWFWFSVNSLNQLVSKDESRGKFLSNIGIVNNIANVLAPVLASIFIKFAGSDVQGYSNIFKVVLFVYLFMIFLAFKIDFKPSAQKFSISKQFDITKDKEWRFTMNAVFMFGIRDSLILMLAGLLVYNATGASGGIYSQLLTLFAVASIIAYYGVSLKMKERNLMKTYKIGAALIASSTIVLVLVPNIFGAIYYGLINAIATPLYSNPYQILVMRQIQSYDVTENIVGRVIVRETFLSFGRIFGMLMIVLASMVFDTNTYLLASVIFCSVFPILLVVYTHFHYKK